MSAMQGKYFLVEESQAQQSTRENVVELGFRLDNIQLPKRKLASREPVSMFMRFFRSRATLADMPSSTGGSNRSLNVGPSSSPPSTTLVTNPNSSFSNKRVTSAVSSSSSSATAKSGSRDSKSQMQHPTCMLRVLEVDEMEADSIKFPLESGGWREVFQSDVDRVVNLEPVTITALLLLPIPPIIATKGLDRRDRPLRFELWIGAPSAKKSQPDILTGVLETSLGKILKDLGSPKRFPHSPNCTSNWNALRLVPVENLHSSILTPPDDCSQLDVRVAFPDRLISVSVPASKVEEEVTEWRLAPLFSGPTLRGLTFCPVSRGFQAPVSEVEEAATTTMIEPKKKRTVRKNGNAATTLMEFREEMAEMPLNLVIPACYLEEAAQILEQTANGYQQKIKNDLALVKKLAHNDLALTPTEMVQKKSVEANDKLMKFANDVVFAKYPERITDMRKCAEYYRGAWSAVVIGDVGENKKLLGGSDHQHRALAGTLPKNAIAKGNHSSIVTSSSSITTTLHRDAQSSSISSQSSLMQATVPNDLSSSLTGSVVNGSAIGVAMQDYHPPDPTILDLVRPNSTNTSDADLLLSESIPPPPSTPNPFADILLNRNSNVGEENDPDDEEDKEDMQAKDNFEKAFGSAAAKGGTMVGTDITTFRPSTSRKDRRLRFMPINMHLQVLTVRETVVRRKIEPKISQTTPAPGGAIRQRLKSVTSLMSSTKAILSPPSPSPRLHSNAQPGSKHSTDDASKGGIVPPVIQEADGPLVLPTRRKGRQSIMQSTMALPPANELLSSSGGGDQQQQSQTTRMGGLTSISSAKEKEARANTLGDVDEEDILLDGAPTSASRSNSTRFDDAESFFYDTISAGAPSAHHLSSKHGGLWQMFKELHKAREEMKRIRDDGKTDLPTKIDALRKVREMEFIFTERVDVVLPQAISIIAGSVISRLYVMAAEYSSSVVGGFEEPDDEVAQSIVKHGFLIGWESLLSTHGKELAMLGDLFYAVRYISEHFVLRLESFGEEDDELDGTAPYRSASGGGDNREGATEESAAEAAARELSDDALNIRLFRTNAKVSSKKIPGAPDYTWVDASTWVGPGGSDDGAVWLIVARIPSTVVEKLPKVLRTYIERATEAPATSLFAAPRHHVVDLEPVSPKPLAWTCVLFTQGINEMQNIANMVGTRALQEEINEFSCIRLVEYCRKRFEVRPSNREDKSSASSSSHTSGTASKKVSIVSATYSSKEAQAKDEERKRRAEVAYRQSLLWAAKLKVAVSNQASTSKSFEILQNSADLVRWLSGIRIASCKSAKDRTAMSLTWEEARILHNVHFVRDIPLLDLANLFREHGTRLINVHKNTGVPRYAFNKTQRSFLPEFYRPPPNTIGGYFGMSNVT